MIPGARCSRPPSYGGLGNGDVGDLSLDGGQVMFFGGVSVGTGDGQGPRAPARVPGGLAGDLDVSPGRQPRAVPGGRSCMEAPPLPGRPPLDEHPAGHGFHEPYPGVFLNNGPALRPGISGHRPGDELGGRVHEDLRRLVPGPRSGGHRGRRSPTGDRGLASCSRGDRETQDQTRSEELAGERSDVHGQTEWVSTETVVPGLELIQDSCRNYAAVTR